MKTSLSRLASVGALTGLSAALVGLAVPADAAPVTKLKMNGKLASTRLKSIGGVVYVPVADVAKALGQKVVPMAGGLEIKTPTGTTQAGQMSGKIGSIIQTKKYSFQVLSVQSAETYASRFQKDAETVNPEGTGDTLYIVNCRLKNILPKAQGPVLARGYAGNTALTDYDAQSYPPLFFDSRITSDFSGASMLPGSKVDFAVVFSVPKTAKIKDLVFTVTDYFDLGIKGTDVRISLG